MTMKKVKKQVVKPRFKSYISDFTIRLDALSLRGRIIGVKKGEDKSYKPEVHLVSPNGNGVVQRYQDSDTGDLFTIDQCDRIVVPPTGDEATIISKQALQDLSKSLLPKNIIALTSHDRAAVENAIFPVAANAYVFEPDAKDPMNVKLTDSVIGALNAGDIALIGQCNFHGYEGLFRASVWRGLLIFQKQAYPTELVKHPVRVEGTASEKDIAGMTSFLSVKKEEFVPEDYRNLVAERKYKALSDPDSWGNTDTVTEQEIDDDVTALLSSLTALSG